VPLNYLLLASGDGLYGSSEYFHVRLESAEERRETAASCILHTKWRRMTLDIRHEADLLSSHQLVFQVDVSQACREFLPAIQATVSSKKGLPGRHSQQARLERGSIATFRGSPVC